IPPTAGFFGKFSIFLEAMQQGLVGLLIVGVLNSVISVYYYFRPIVAMYSSDEETVLASTSTLVTSGGEAVAARTGGVSFGVALAVTLCAVGVIGMIVLQYIAFPLVLEAAPVSGILR